jgi:hypothetical protein
MSARVSAAHSARFTGFFTVKNFQNYFCCLNALRPRRVASLVTGRTGCASRRAKGSGVR